MAVNIIADPSWDHERFKVVRDWCLEIPEVVNISINTPYPGTETWHTESRRLTTRDYRLFDIQHAVLPTKLPLPEFYKELVDTQRVLSCKHLGWSALRDCARIVVRQLLRGQTNFIRMLWKFNSVYNPEAPTGRSSATGEIRNQPAAAFRYYREARRAVISTKIKGAEAVRSIITRKNSSMQRAWAPRSDQSGSAGVSSGISL